MEWMLWVDIETTGLDAQNDQILQIACILTSCEDDHQFFTEEYTFNHVQHTLDNMNEWCKKQHKESGLYDQVLCSTCNLHDVEKHIVISLNQHLKVMDRVYLAGNSVHFDKKFIDYHMPLLSARLSHRIIDVSTIAILCSNIAPSLYINRPQKMHNHTAMEDILESIREYKYYKTVFLVNAEQM
jgi:oligoribonuclease